MKVDNSGPAVVFSQKTKEAIEEGKNRVTLLQVEELRLTKLKNSLEADLIKLEGDIVYKNKLVSDKEKELSDLEISLNESIKQLNAANEFYSETKVDTESRLKVVEIAEVSLKEKEKSLNVKEKAIDKREAELKVSESKATATMNEINEKKAKIDALLKTL